MLVHAALHSPYYREQEWAGQLRAERTVSFFDIPTTPPAAVKTQTERFVSDFVPPSDGPVEVKRSGGSTGEPIAMRMTARFLRGNAAENARLKEGWGFGGPRRLLNVLSPDEEHPAGTLYEQALPGGRQKWTLHTVETSLVFETLRQTSASYVWGLTSVIHGALEHGGQATPRLPLQLIHTVSEVVPDEMRALVRTIPGCRLADLYGCTEAGIVAMQCPQCDAYHPADRHVHLELLTEDGRPAGAGEMGRVVLTPLFNRAMPLVRYEVGDYAVRAARNDCPRSPVAISRIVGREQSMFKLPDGRRLMPLLPGRAAERLGVRKYKLFQTTLRDIELHYIPLDAGGEVAESLAQELVDMFMAPGFKVRCVRVAEIPRSPSGKYLLHESFV